MFFREVFATAHGTPAWPSYVSENLAAMATKGGTTCYIIISNLDSHGPFLVNNVPREPWQGYDHRATRKLPLVRVLSRREASRLRTISSLVVLLYKGKDHCMALRVVG
jgi:hypothetical protein